MTNFGALVNGSMTTAQKIGILNNLGVEYTRNAINISTWTGTQHNAYDQYIAASKKVLLNLNWAQSSGGPVPFPTNMVTYAALVNDILDTIAAPEMIVVENEEINPDYHDSPDTTISDYVTMLATMAGIAHARGLKVANGGVYGTGIDILVYRYLDAVYGTPTASAYADGTMTTAQRNAAITPNSNPTLEAKAATVLAVLDGIISGDVDYVNIHPYEISDPRITNDADILTITPDIVRYQKEYVEFYTGKPCITNETGQRDNVQPALVAGMLQNYSALGFEYCIWFNGLGEAGAQPLNLQVSPYSLEPNGIAFRDTVFDLSTGSGNIPPIVVINTPDTNLMLPDNTLTVNATVIDLDGTVTLLWTEETGNNNYTIDDPTATEINLSDLQEGEYVFKLTATDDDGDTGTAIINIWVNGIYDGNLPTKTFRGFLCNAQGKCYYQGSNGNIALASIHEVALPKEWQEIEISQSRNKKYFGLDRNYTSAYTFVKDAAAVIRYLLYNPTQRGIESTLYFLVTKWDTTTGIYEPYFTSEVDLSKVIDKPHDGILVNMLEGGAAKAIKTNEGVTYGIPCNASNPKCIRVYFDGLDLFDKLNFSFVPADIPFRVATAPIVFLNNEGDSIGVVFGSQILDHVVTTDYYTDSANTTLVFLEETTVTIEGKIVIDFQDGVDPGDGDISAGIILRTDTGQEISLLSPFPDLVITAGQEYSFSQAITLAPGEKLFILEATADILNVAKIVSGTFSLSYTTKAPPTTNYALKPFDLFEALVEKIGDGRYKAESTLLNDKEYLVAIAGDALRGLENAQIKTTFEEFYKSYGSILGAAIGVRQSDQTILFERKEYFFDNATEITDLGEVEGLNISIAEDYLFNSIVIGYPDQNYQQRNGRDEFNDEQNYTTPIDRDPKILDLRSVYRADPFGIEFIRAELALKTTTDNTGDNNVFVVNVDNSVPVYDTFEADAGSTPYTDQTFDIAFDSVPDTNTSIDPNIGLTEFEYIGTVAQSVPLSLHVAGSYSTITGFVASIQINGIIVASRAYVEGSPFDFTITTTRTLQPNDIIKCVINTFQAGGTITLSAELTAQLLDNTGISVYPLRRAAYSAITGIQATATIFNIEELTPKRMLLANGSYIGGAMYNQQGDIIEFQSGKKNVLLSTTLAGVTITENSNVLVDDLAASYYRPFVFEFKTKVPINILNLLNNSGKGYITFSWNGATLYGFPVDLNIKPAFRDAQTWKLLCSSLTDVAALQTINEDRLQIEDFGMISHKNSLKFVYITDAYPSQYHFKQMDNDWHKNRISRYAVTKQYFQKQQTDDTTPMQFITKSVAIAITILNCKGRTIDTITLTQKTNAAIVNPWVLLEGEILWQNYTPGTYYVKLVAGYGAGAKTYISEPIWVADSWDKTLLFEFTNSLNTQDMIFTGDYGGKLRVEGMIEKYVPEMKYTSFEDDPLDTDTIYGVASRSYTLFIGGDFGLPDWMIDKLQRILLLDSVQIDGYYYSIAPESKFERVEIPGSPYDFWSIPIREMNNRQGISITGEGIDGSDITVEYNINTKGFTSIQSPTANQQNNVVQVENIE